CTPSPALMPHPSPRHLRVRSAAAPCCSGSYPPTTAIYALSLNDALPISVGAAISRPCPATGTTGAWNTSHPVRAGINPAPTAERSEEHTSELQSRFDLVCRLLLEKKKQQKCKKPAENTEATRGKSRE